MRRRFRIAVAVWIAGTTGVAVGMPAADPSALFAEASAAFAEGDYAAAAARFDAAKEAGMTGPAVDYNRGVSYYRLGEFAEAERIFRELAAAYPEMRPLAEYNVGLTLIRQARPVEARQAFESARAGSDPAVAALADQMLERTAPAEPIVPAAKAAWIGLFDFALGYDDNVALVDESSLPAGLSTSSPMLEAFGFVRGRLGRARAVRVDASAYLMRYAEAESFDQDGVQIGIAYLFDAGGWQLDAGSHYAYSLLAGDGFEYRVGASMTARRPIGERAAMSLRYVRDNVGELSPEYRYVKGSRDRVSVALEQRRVRGTLELGYVHERNDREGANVSPERHELFAGYEYWLGAAWSLGVTGSLRTSRYGRLPVPRDESLSQLSLTASRAFRSGWQLLGQYRVSENSSSDETFEYDRNRFVVSLNRIF